MWTLLYFDTHQYLERWLPLWEKSRLAWWYETPKNSLSILDETSVILNSTVVRLPPPDRICGGSPYCSPLQEQRITSIWEKRLAYISWKNAYRWRPTNPIHYEFAISPWTSPANATLSFDRMNPDKSFADIAFVLFLLPFVDPLRAFHEVWVETESA